jgi:hypothetical protein
LLFLNLAYFHQSKAQELSDTVEYRIETQDGNVYIGRVVDFDPGKITLNTDNLGTITVDRTQIKRMEAIDENQFKKGGYWFPNPQSTRYFWTPSGYGLKKGEGYYQNVWVLFNQVAYGITDNVSIGAGLVPLFLFGGANTPIWITPKVSIPITKDKVNLGIGALVGTITGADIDEFGVIYGIGTFGSRDKNLSVGLGWGYGGGELADRPTITLSAMIRTGPRGYFMTENYFVDAGTETVGMVSFGGRRIIGNAALDYGLFIPWGSDIGTFVAAPWLGISFPFGNKPFASPNR